MLKPTFITGNRNKVQALERWLGFGLPHHELDLDELQQLDIERVILHKAEQAYELMKTPVLVEDVSLEFHALNRLPGTFVKWFIKEIGTEGLCALLAGFEDRRAKAICCYGIHDGVKVHTFVSEVEGKIADQPRGELGFGWDPIFIPDGTNQTYAEMDEQTISEHSVRNRAVRKLRGFLESN